jgi:hypothetical protein
MTLPRGGKTLALRRQDHQRLRERAGTAGQDCLHLRYQSQLKKCFSAVSTLGPHLIGIVLIFHFNIPSLVNKLFNVNAP